MSSFFLIVTTPPQTNLTHTALTIAQSIVKQGYQLLGVFFYQDGVLNASSLIQQPSDEQNIATLWQQFAKTTNTPLHLCISAAERRGLSDGKSNLATHNIAPEFIISGLGELAVLSAQAERTIQL